jgi:hypothetical protein
LENSGNRGTITKKRVSDCGAQKTAGMSDSITPKKKSAKRKRVRTTAITLLVVLLSWWGAPHILPHIVPALGRDNGQLYEAVASLFSALAFAGVIVTLFLQTDELKLQRKELKLNRIQLARQAEAQKQQALAQEHTAKAAKESAESAKRMYEQSALLQQEALLERLRKSHAIFTAAEARTKKNIEECVAWQNLRIQTRTPVSISAEHIQDLRDSAVVYSSRHTQDIIYELAAEAVMVTPGLRDEILRQSRGDPIKEVTKYIALMTEIGKKLPVLIQDTQKQLDALERQMKS